MSTPHASADETAPVGDAIDETALLDTIRSVVVELHPHAASRVRVGLDTSLDRDLGLDSLARVELLSRVEAAFGRHLPESVVAGAETPRDVLRALEAGRSGAGPARSVAPSMTPTSTAGGAPAAADESPPIETATLVDALLWHADRHPERVHVHLCEEDGSVKPVTYGALLERARSVAGGLQATGIGPGESVAIMLPTGIEYLATFFGIQLAGAVPVPIYPPARISQVEDHFRRHARILANAGTRALVTFDAARRVSRLLTGQVDGLAHVVTTETLERSGLGAHAALPGARDVAFLQYTSGSTGTPKGVVLTHADVMTSLRSMSRALEAGPRDVFVSWLPLYHDMGLIGAWLGSLVVGFPLVLMSPLTFLSRPERWLRAIESFGGTLSGGPNFAYELCLRRIEDAAIEGIDLSTWRVAFNGAEPVSPDTLAHFADRFGRHGLRAEALAPVYGLAEATLGVTFTPLGRGPRVDRVRRGPMHAEGRAVPAADDDRDALRFVSSGVPIPEFEVRVVDDGGHEAPDRTEGSVEFLGPSTTSGYHRNPEATRALFDGDWLVSGDRGYVADGELFVTGRSKDVVIRAGRNVYPYELEQAIAEVEGVRRGCVAVFGAADPRSGTERLVVVAETRETDGARRERMRERIEALAQDVLGMPADEVVLAPPQTVLKTSSGKIRRAAMAALHAHGALGPARRAVWLQLARLALTTLVPQLRRVWRLSVERLYAAYAWALLVAAVAVVWPLVAVSGSPRRAARICGVGARWLLRLAGIRYTQSHVDRVPPRGPCVIVANHQSFLDGLVLYATLPGTPRFVAKAELRSSAFARVFLERLGTCFVERFDRKRSVEDARALRRLLDAGESLVFFPEGTFHRMPGLLPFHLGAFASAVEVGVPVVPVVLRGTRSVLRGEEFYPRRGRVRVHVCEPVTAGGEGAGTWDRALALRDRVRGEMLRRCAEPDLADRNVMSALADRHAAREAGRRRADP